MARHDSIKQAYKNLLQAVTVSALCTVFTYHHLHQTDTNFFSSVNTIYSASWQDPSLVHLQL